MSRPMNDREQAAALLQSLRMELDHWYATSQADVNKFHAKATERLDHIRAQLMNPTLVLHRQRNAGGTGSTPSTPPPPPRRSAAAGELSQETDWSIVGTDVTATPPANSRREITPTGSPQSSAKMPLEQLFNRITQANNAPPINFDTLYEQLAGKEEQVVEKPPQRPEAVTKQPAMRTFVPITSIVNFEGQAQTTTIQLTRGENGRPIVTKIPGASGTEDPLQYGIDPNNLCQVLVEFKRRRVLQYESRQYVGPGEYVVVGGDRGEDVGLVIYAWGETNQGKVRGVGLAGSALTRNIGVGSGKVLRLATPLEVSQLHGLQSELERRAIDSCQQRVLEHGLPMVIVDAEYQFDNKKLTFYYEAQQRLDFRELVRDLFKTFRARIWMELVE